MARLIKGAKRYVLLRGKNEAGHHIVIDIFDKKSLGKALREERIAPEDDVVMVEVLGKAELKKPRKRKK